MGDIMDWETQSISPEAVRRNGFFHCWGSVHRYDSQKGESYIVMVAIVEDEEGKIHEISPNRIGFVEKFND